MSTPRFLHPCDRHGLPRPWQVRCESYWHRLPKRKGMRMNPRRIQRQHKIVLHDEPISIETACAHAARPHAHFTPPTDDTMANLGLAEYTICERDAAAGAGRGEFPKHHDTCLTWISPDAPHQAHAHGAVSGIHRRGRLVIQRQERTMWWRSEEWLKVGIWSREYNAKRNDFGQRRDLRVWKVDLIGKRCQCERPNMRGSGKVTCVCIGGVCSLRAGTRSTNDVGV